MPDDTAKWLAGLQVGDPVVLQSCYSSLRRRRRIVRITPMFFVVNYHQWFRRSNGHGRGRARSHWQLEMPTAAERRKAKAGKAG